MSGSHIEFELPILTGTDRLRNRGASRLWYRQSDAIEISEGPDLPELYRLRSTSLLSPDVIGSKRVECEIAPAWS